MRRRRGNKICVRRKTYGVKQELSSKKQRFNIIFSNIILLKSPLHCAVQRRYAFPPLYPACTTPVNRNRIIIVFDDDCCDIIQCVLHRCCDARLFLSSSVRFELCRRAVLAFPRDMTQGRN